MNSLKTCSLILMVVPFLIVCSPVMAEGCLNYGPACLGGHGKRSALHNSFREVPMMRILYRMLESPALTSSQSKDNSIQGTELYHQGVRPNNERIDRTPQIQDYEDNLMKNQILDSEDRDDYPYEGVGRFDVEMASSTKEEPEAYSDWNREMESSIHHKGKNDNRNYINLRSWRKR
ncbi:uncharacterized protein [Palaemon carinicauda]|uniref:uncharacterized protein isoform X2 n=1 Tax=Palaemon carinicauda TaxID=392227 RepID=UPI0035B5BE9C